MNYSIEYFSQFKNQNQNSEDISSSKGVMAFCIIEDSVLLVKRSETMPSHKGQVALIGGHRKDSEDFPYSTVLREFIEETSLEISKVEIITSLPKVYTARELSIIPVLMIYHDSLDQVSKKIKSNGEWDFAFSVKIADLLQNEFWMEALRINNSNQQNFLFRPLFEREIRQLSGQPTFPLMLWGASARVVEHVRKLILTKS